VFNNSGTFTGNTPWSATAIQYINSGSGATGMFVNTGSLTINPGSSNTTQINALLNMSNSKGTVTISSGTLLLDGGGSDTAGAFNVSAGSTLDFGGGYTYLASSVGTSSTPQAGAVVFSGNSTTDVVGSYNISTTSSTTVSGGTANFTSSSTLTSLGGTVTISSGTADIDPNVNINTLNLNGGTLTGTGTVTVKTALTWNGSSTMSGTGTTTLVSGATMDLGGDKNGDQQTLDVRTFNNQGTTIWEPGSYYLNLDDGAMFNNSGSFTGNTPWSATAIQYINSGSGATGMFVNTGSLTINPGSGKTTQVNALLNNQGTVTVSSGTLLLDGGGTSTGSFAVSSGSTLQFNGGIDNLNASTTSVTGTGTVAVTAGEVDFGGTYNLTGAASATNISGGIANFLNGGTTSTFTNSGGTVGLASGATFTVSAGDYTQSGGTTYLNGGTLAVAAGHKVNIEQNTNLYGPGAITGNLANDGNIYVGGGQSLTGTLAVSGTFTQTTNGTLFMNVGGTTAGTQYDQLTVGGAATFGGTLDVFEVNGFSPNSGTFTLITYASRVGMSKFATTSLPGGWTSSYNPTSFTATA
jgi:hypothetical protein